MLPFIAFCLSAVFFIVAFTGGHLTHDPQLAGLVFLAVGLALSQLPWQGPPWPGRRTP